jgi:hypothetical protein
VERSAFEEKARQRGRGDKWSRVPKSLVVHRAGTRATQISVTLSSLESSYTAKQTFDPKQSIVRRSAMQNISVFFLCL